MNSDSVDSENDETADSRTRQGPRKLNRILIALAVVAFGLIVTDRVMEAFQADDVPEELAVEDSSADTADSQTLAEDASELTPDTGSALLDHLPEAEALVTLENLFGSPVVLVSASKPSYVITADERRFDVGSVVDDATTLAGVTSHQLIFEQAGDLMVISLPEPSL